MAEIPYFDVLVVGAGQAGVQTVVSLVRGNYSGAIALLSDESTLPYERPPLSKSYLRGEDSLEAIQFRTQEYWSQSPVSLLLDHRVTQVDAEAGYVRTEHGAQIGFGTLVWAAGGSARKLPVSGSDLDGVLSLRDLADADDLQRRLAPDARAVIIGGGYIGLEAAAVLRECGIATTLVEAADRVLARVTSPVLSDYYTKLHQKNGVRIIVGGGVDCINGDRGRVQSVTLTDGEVIPADFVIVGVGIMPNADPLAKAGVAVDNGVLVDEFGRTKVPNIYAAGDLTRHVSRFAGDQLVRIESVQNATDQAKAVASAILGSPQPYSEVPRFWSNQYSAKLKTVGLLTGYDDIVVRGDIASDRFSVV